MSLFKNMLKEDESLFLDPIALDYDYLPKLLPFRENEQKYIATCIKPLFQDRSGKNLFISGSQGIGKTAATRHVLRDLENQTSDILPIYINCWKKNSSFKIALELCSQLNYKFTHNKSTDQLLNVILPLLNKKSIVLCLDECDKIQEFDIIYNLLEDINKKTIILITNEKSWLANLDNRIRSRLTPDSIDFKAYNKKETFEILKQRCDYAFVPNIFESEAFNLIAEKTSELQDIRTGLFLLKESANIAESLSLKKITLEHSQKALSSLTDFKTKSSDDLEEEEFLLNLIKENSGKTQKEIFDIFLEKNGNKSYRTFSRYIKNLEKGKLISIKEVNKGHKGKSYIIDYVSLKKLNEF